METKDHLALARIIVSCNNQFEKTLHAKAFETGCISPDINIATYIKGHTYKGTISYVRNTISKLQGRFQSVTDYYELGRIIHYIADYFTFPHSPDFTGNLKQHVEYESMLHQYIENSREMNNAEDIHSKGKILKCTGFIDSAHEKYLSIRHSVKSDWQFIRSVCTGVTSSLTCHSNAVCRKNKLAKPACGTL